MNYILQKVNCKALIIALFVFMGALLSIRSAYAYDRVYIYTSGTFNLENTFIPSLTSIKQSYVLDVSPRSSLSNSVTISYDSLSDLVYYCNEHGLSTSLVYNNSVDRYVAYVSDREFKISALSTVSIVGCLGNSDGKVYVAEKPKQDVNITITTPTNPDYTDRLLEIASDLDFIPIIAELNVLIADNQTLLMEYIKLAIESIWDFENSMIDHIDDFNTAVNNRLAYLGAKTASIDSLLSSVVTDGKVQVDVSSLDWKLDRLLSMYTEVNSVEFDTAAFDGSTGAISITNAAGGAVSNLMFWGEPYSFGYNERLFYSLDNQRYFIDSADGSYIPLYGLALGTSIPESVSSSYTLSSGVWQRSDGQYVISDTYEAKTGRLIRRTQFDTDGNLVVAASPQEVLCPSHTMILPAGNSNFFEGFCLRITFNYDQLGSVTKTADIITAINNIPTYDDTNLISAVTTISDQITEQFGEYDSTYSFPNFSTSGQSSSSNKTVSGVLPSAFTSINPGTRKLLYSPSGTLTLSKSTIYTGGGTCRYVSCYAYIHQTYGLGYRLEYDFYFSSTQSASRTETVQFPQVSFTDYSGKTLTLYQHTGTVSVAPYSRYAYAYSYYFPRWDASGSWLGWSGQNDTFQWTSSTYEPSKRVYLTPPESGTYYIYGTSDTAIPVVYASRFTGFLQSQTDRVVNAVGSIPAPNDYTAQLTAVTDKLDALANKPTVDLTNIESALSTISDKLDNTASDVNNTIINITNDNDYFSVFYITDGDGNTQSVTDFAGDLTGASGKLLSLLYRLVFSDALDSVDSDLGNIEDFFTSEEPPVETTALDGDTAPANEVIDVWAS